MRVLRCAALSTRLRSVPTVVAALAALAVGACGSEPRVALESLEVRDSVYVQPATGEPFTGRVYRTFADDPDRVELEGRLERGTWNGELTVYHAGGSIRYQGRLADGAPCGAWVENREGGEELSLYEELVREIESMGLYPPCPD